MINPNDLVIVRRGDVEALKQESIFGVFRRDAVEFDKLNAMLANAPVVSGEPVAYRHLHDDGWEYYDAPTGSDCSSCKALFTAPQQSQSVADALEEAAKLCDDYALDIQEGIVNDPSKLADAIRALIKRNTEGVE